MRNTNNNNNNSPEDQRKKESTLTSLDSRFNQTLRNVQGLLKGRSIPGKILLTRRSDPLDESSVQERTPSMKGASHTMKLAQVIAWPRQRR
ncbi:hypothetical protein CFP56_001334 [Quercus suber]|uniref:Uncharacterized protein n=1 Tax=Quercus suber TaxID=58331 RepID=A0AAW0LGR8_QUESU